MPLTVIEGTWEEIERRKTELIGHRLRVMIQPEKPMSRQAAPPESAPASQTAARQHTSALGKYAFVSGGSEEFAGEKQVEIEREDRMRP